MPAGSDGRRFGVDNVVVRSAAAGGQVDLVDGSGDSRRRHGASAASVEGRVARGVAVARGAPARLDNGVGGARAAVQPRPVRVGGDGVVAAFRLCGRNHTPHLLRLIRVHQMVRIIVHHEHAIAARVGRGGGRGAQDVSVARRLRDRPVHHAPRLTNLGAGGAEGVRVALVGVAARAIVGDARLDRSGL